jgi:hypothetical protein
MHSVFAALLLLLIAVDPANARHSTSSSSSSSTMTPKTPKTPLSYYPNGAPSCPCINVSEDMVNLKCASDGSDAGGIDGAPDCWPDNFGSDQCINWSLSLDDVKDTTCFDGVVPISPPPRGCFGLWCYVDPAACDIKDGGLPSEQFPDSGLFWSKTTCGNDYK